jgi:hypothetical protein
MPDNEEHMAASTSHTEDGIKACSEHSVNLYNMVGVKTKGILVAYFIIIIVGVGI